MFGPPRWTACGRPTGTFRGGWPRSSRSSAPPRFTSSTTSPPTAECASLSFWMPARTSMADDGLRSHREQVLAALRQAKKLVAVTHENPDGDALGSLVAMTHVLRALGKDCQAFIDRRELPLPREYDFLNTVGLLTEPPEDLG